MEHIVEVSEVTKYYKSNLAVNNVSFKIRAGIIFGLLGTNGAGKTTTIKLLTGQLLPSKGKIKVCGLNPSTQEKKLAAKIGVVTEQVSLYLDMSVENNLLFFAKLYQVKPERVQEVMEQLGLAEYRKTKIKALSKGYKQRVLIGRAILHDPELIFMDEPTSGLDPNIALEIREMIVTLKEIGKTIILTTHDMNEAEELCDEVLIINRGSVALHNNMRNIKRSRKELTIYVETTKGRKEYSLGELHKISSLPEEEIISIYSNTHTLKEIFINQTNSKGKGNVLERA